MQELEERIYRWFLKRSTKSASGKVRTSGVMARLCKEISSDPIAIRQALLNLQSEGQLLFTADPRGEPISSHITVIRPTTQASEHENSWRTVLAEAGLSDMDQSALYPIHMALEDFSVEGMEILLAGLIKLRNKQHQIAGQPAFIVSASYLMGSSKLLSTLDGKSLRVFGIDIDKFPSRPPYVMVGGGGTSPESLILVENPIAFETAIQSQASDRHTFLCTFGFGLSNSSSEYGNQLASVIETGRAILLRRLEGPHISFDELICHPEIHFWGDLDIAGLQIFERIAYRIQNLKLSALYEPMIKATEHSVSRHPYVAAVGKAGQKSFQPTRKDTAAMLEICVKWAVDQEIVNGNDVLIFAGATLEYER